MNAIVLAGGRSTRMGRDKSLLPFDGVPLARRVIERFRPHVREVILVVADPASYAGYGARVVADVFPGRGPLGGIHAGLLASDADLNAVVACDMPFASPELAAALAALAGGFDAVVPVVGERWEPLHAVYARSCLPAAEALLTGGGTLGTAGGGTLGEAGGGTPGLVELLGRVRVRPVPIEELDPAGRLRDALINVNTPDDLAAAKRLMPLSHE